jgi:hypothetical protein
LSNLSGFYEVIDIITDKCKYGDKIHLLTKSEKVIYLIASLEGEVNNGGLRLSRSLKFFCDIDLETDSQTSETPC